MGDAASRCAAADRIVEPEDERLSTPDAWNLYARFPLGGVDHYCDVLLERPLKDDVEEQFLIRQTLAFLQFYKERLEYGEQYEAADQVAVSLRGLGWHMIERCRGGPA
jgi:hypothetical protein